MADVLLNGIRHHVQRLGETSGSPVVFLHGLVMDNLSSWYFTVATQVAKSHRAVLYDLRGHGRSERATTGYGLEALSDDLLALIDHEELAGVTLVGHSFGGTLALATALRSERVERLVLVDPLVPEPGWGERMAGTLTLGEHERNAVIADRFQDWLGRHSSRKRTRLERHARFLVEETSLLADLRTSRSWPLEAFADLTIPVRMLNGASSDVRPQCERLEAHLPDVQTRWIEGTHSILWEQTEVVCTAIEDALDRT